MAYGVSTKIPFRMVDETDFSTPETGVTGITVTLSLDCASFVAATNSVYEIGLGFYYVELTTTEAKASTIIMRAVGAGCAETIVPISTSYKGSMRGV